MPPEWGVFAPLPQVKPQRTQSVSLQLVEVLLARVGVQSIEKYWREKDPIQCIGSLGNWNSPKFTKSMKSTLKMLWKTNPYHSLRESWHIIEATPSCEVARPFSKWPWQSLDAWIVDGWASRGDRWLTGTCVKTAWILQAAQAIHMATWGSSETTQARLRLLRIYCFNSSWLYIIIEVPKGFLVRFIAIHWSIFWPSCPLHPPTTPSWSLDSQHDRQL